MGDLRNRLAWDEGRGALADGPRRYLMMRPDVLMGAVATLDCGARGAWLDAWAASTALHGAASLQAYAEAVAFDADALMAATAQAAADLGWGRWQLTLEAGVLRLAVDHSPFVDGWRAAATRAAPSPVCAPVRGLLQALAQLVLRGDAITAEETHCAAMQGHDAACRCHFTARRPA